MTNGKNIALAMLACFAVIFLFEWLIHGVLLMNSYIATAHLWRPMEDMQAMMAFCIMVKLLKAGVIAVLLTKHFDATGTGDRISYGLYIGLLMGLVQFGAYMYIPVPLALAGAWLASDALIGVLCSIAVAILRDNKKA